MTPERQRKGSTVEITSSKTGSRGTPADEQRKERKENNRTEGNVSKEIQPRKA
jgi:hypothetical protein